MGMIRLRGDKYWIKYYRAGKAYEESVDKVLGRHGTHADAKTLLKKREGAIADGRFFGLAAEKTEFGGYREVRIPADSCDYERDEKRYVAYGMVKELIDDYRLNQRKSLDRALRSSWELARRFEGFRLARITTDQITEYKITRVKENMANASINRELAALRRIFHLALSSTPPKVPAVPKIVMLEENNVRMGFFEHAEYLAVRGQLQDYLKPVLDCGYTYGGRRKEILSIEWPMVDMISGKINLGKSKNGEPRIWYLTPGIYKTLLEYKMRRDKEYPEQKKVLVRPDGAPIIDFKEGWESACRRCGLEGKLFHDLRRTAVRNMEIAGISRKVAMQIAGLKTEHIYSRYRIIAEPDLSAATARMVDYYQTMAGKIDDYAKKVTNTVTMEEAQRKEKRR